jgi:hypothetical protein
MIPALSKIVIASPPNFHAWVKNNIKGDFYETVFHGTYDSLLILNGCASGTTCQRCRGHCRYLVTNPAQMFVGHRPCDSMG